jgi:SulP family sulfate permease
MVIVLVLTIFVNLLQAVAVGIVLASVLFMKKMGDTAEAQAYASTMDSNAPLSISDEDNFSENVYVQNFDGPIFFGFTAHFNKMMAELPQVNMVILRMEKVPYIDQTGMYALEDAILQLEKRGIEVLITGIQKQPLDMLRGIKVIPALISEDEVFKDFETVKRFASIAGNCEPKL